MIPEQQLAEYRRVAEAATPGPWTAHVDDMEDEEDCAFEVRPPRKEGMPELMHPTPLANCAAYPKRNKDNAAHIATFNPETVGQLLAEITALREALRFYADPWSKTEDVPDFYSEMDFAETARAALGDTDNG